MKINKFIKPLLSLLSFLMVLSCSVDKEEIQSEANEIGLTIRHFDQNLFDVYQKFDDHTLITYKVTIEGSKKLSKLSISNQNRIIYETVYDVDTSSKNYKLDQIDNVKNIANNLDYKLTLDDYTKINDQFQSFFEAILEEFNNPQDINVLSTLFFHNAILSSKKRSLENNDKNCECTLHPGYLLGKNNFFCQEDFLIEVTVVKNTIQQNKSAFQGPGSVALLNYLNSTKASKSKYISFDTLYGFFVDKDLYLETLSFIKSGKTKNQDKCSGWCPLGCGSSWGCCGNYSGCCLYSNPICYLHDGICTNCSYRRFCLPGCVPDQASEIYEPLPEIGPEDWGPIPDILPLPDFVPTSN